MVFAATNTFNNIWVVGQTISASSTWADWGIPYILGTLGIFVHFRHFPVYPD